MESISMGS